MWNAVRTGLVRSDAFLVTVTRVPSSCSQTPPYAPPASCGATHAEPTSPQLRSLPKPSHPNPSNPDLLPAVPHQDALLHLPPQAQLLRRGTARRRSLVGAAPRPRRQVPGRRQAVRAGKPSAQRHGRETAGRQALERNVVIHAMRRGVGFVLYSRGGQALALALALCCRMLTM